MPWTEEERAAMRAADAEIDAAEADVSEFDELDAELDALAASMQVDERSASGSG